MPHRYTGQKLGPVLECSDSGVTMGVKKVNIYIAEN